MVSCCSNNLASASNNLPFLNVRHNWQKLGMGMILPATDGKFFSRVCFNPPMVMPFFPTYLAMGGGVRGGAGGGSAIPPL